VGEGGSVRIDLAANDSDVDDALDLASIRIVAAPARGRVAVNSDGTVDYVATRGAASGDSFTYSIDDAFGLASNVAQVSVAITGSVSDGSGAGGGGCALATGRDFDPGPPALLLVLLGYRLRRRPQPRPGQR